MEARRKGPAHHAAPNINSNSTESSGAFASAQVFSSQCHDKLVPQAYLPSSKHAEPGSRSPPPSLIQNTKERDRVREKDEPDARRQPSTKETALPTRQMARLSLASSLLPDPTGCFELPIIEGVPEVLQTVHLKKLVPALQSEPEYKENLLGSGGSAILSPLNAITPPPCVIQPKNHLLLPTHSAASADNSPTAAQGTSKAPASGTHFFDIYDVKSIGPYKLTKTLGSGSTGKVKLAVHEKTGEKLAVKIVPRDPPPPPPPAAATAAATDAKDAPAAPSGARKKKTTLESALSKEARLLREVSLLSLLAHPHIVRLYGYSSTASYYLLFMEYIEGGQLLNYVVSHGRLKERHACQFFRQLLSAVGYCHSNSIVHRDLKIENILIDRDGSLKLIDFGLSNFYNPVSVLNTFCGSLYYAAPELLSGKPYRGPEVDVWSLGVILYVLTTGKVPFDDKKLPVLHEKIKAGVVEYPSYLSPELRYVLSRMIVKDPLNRATMQELYENRWVASASSSEGPPNMHVPVRFPLDPPFDPQVVYGIVQSLGCQYSPNLVLSFLFKAARDWQAHSGHPIVSLYYLVKEKLQRWIQQNQSSSSNGTDLSAAAEVSDESMPITGLGLWRHGRRYSSLASSISITEPIRSHVSPRSPLPNADHRANRKSYLGSPKLNISTTKLTLPSIASTSQKTNKPSGQIDPAKGRSHKSSQSSDRTASPGHGTGQSWMAHWIPGVASFMKTIRGDPTGPKSKETSCDSHKSITLDSAALSPDVARLKNVYLKGLFSVHVMPTHVLALASATDVNAEASERYRVQGLKAALIAALSALGLQFKETETGLHVQYAPSLDCLKSEPAPIVGRASAHASSSPSSRQVMEEPHCKRSSSTAHLFADSQAPRRVTFGIDIVRLGWTAELALQFRKWAGTSSGSHVAEKLKAEVIGLTERNILNGPRLADALPSKRNNSSSSLTVPSLQPNERKQLIGSRSIPSPSVAAAAAAATQAMSSPLRKSFTAAGLGERERTAHR